MPEWTVTVTRTQTFNIVADTEDEAKAVAITRTTGLQGGQFINSSVTATAVQD